MDIPVIIQIVQFVLTVLIIPTIIFLANLHTKVIICQTKVSDDKEAKDIIFEKLDKNREDLHEVNKKIEKVITALDIKN